MVLITLPKTYAQLGSIGSFSFEVRCLYADAITQKLYIAAQPPSFYDGKPTFGLAYYDFVTGTGDTMSTAVFRLADMYSITRADSFLYFGGGFDTLGGNTIRSYIKYDGQNWKFKDPGYILNNPMGGGMNALYYDGDSILYMGADSKKFLSPIPNTIIGRNIKTASWVYLPALDNSSNFYFVSTICQYQGDLYVCGQFKLPGNQGYGIARLVNNNWQKLGAGIPSPDVFEDMIEYNGQLIAAGGVSYVMVWNGVQWLNAMALPAVGPFFARVYDLEVYGGVLYAAGVFTLPDGSRNIAKWDGNNWVGIGLTSFSGPLGGFVNSIQIYNNTLYMGGYFDSINGQPFLCLAKIDNLVGVEELAAPIDNLQSYPNPVQDKLTIVCPVGWENQQVNISIYNTAGQKMYNVKTKIINGKANFTHMLNINPGMYVVVLQNEKVWARTVMVKQ